MMLNNTQLHNLMSDREKLHKEVKRKAREASDFQVKVGEMKRKEASSREIVRDGGGFQGKAPGEPSTKGADSHPGWFNHPFLGKDDLVDLFPPTISCPFHLPSACPQLCEQTYGQRGPAGQLMDTGQKGKEKATSLKGKNEPQVSPKGAFHSKQTFGRVFTDNKSTVSVLCSITGPNPHSVQLPHCGQPARSCQLQHPPSEVIIQHQTSTIFRTFSMK